MTEFVRTVNGKIVAYGKAEKDGAYVVYERLDIKSPDGLVEQVQNVAVNPNLAKEIGDGVAFQFSDAKNFNAHYKYDYLCAVQTKSGDVFSDDRLLKVVYKTRYAIAYLSLIPPFTLIAPWVFSKAKKLKAAHEQVGVFEPLKNGFIQKTSKKKF